MEVCGYESLYIGGSFNSLYTTSVGYESLYIGGSFNSLYTTSVSTMLTLFSPSICFSYLLFWSLITTWKLIPGDWVLNTLLKKDADEENNLYQKMAIVYKYGLVAILKLNK